MELTKEQISIVKKYLDKKEVYYLDVRIEILDHIISDIENSMSNGIEFEKAFFKIINKCKPMLEQDSSVFLGYAYSKPKVIIDKMKKIIKPHALKTWLILIILFISRGFKFDIPITYVSLINIFAMSLICILSALICIGYLHIKFTKQKTSYFFLYKTQVLPFLLPILIFYDGSITKTGNLDILKMVILVLALFIFKLGYSVYNSHFDTVNKYVYKWS